mmetsp:Transcript_11016/g.18408  ORF Transcript_11016/g.18408 Transcript_11016/m.18408 type:complete len:233 (-) Transcript_11016:623-1321(-)
MASTVDERAKKFGDHKFMNKAKNILKLALITLILIVLAFCTWLSVYSIANDKNKVSLVGSVFGINFIVLGLAFGIIGFLNNQRLKYYFKDFYLENQKMLQLATLGLSIPIMIRGCLDISRRSKSFQALIMKHQAIYDTLLFLLCDLVPMGFQFSSLVFGYIRKQKNKKYRLEVQERLLTQSSNQDNQFERNSQKSMTSALSDNSNFFDPPLLEHFSAYNRENSVQRSRLSEI